MPRSRPLLAFSPVSRSVPCGLAITRGWSCGSLRDLSPLYLFGCYHLTLHFRAALFHPVSYLFLGPFPSPPSLLLRSLDLLSLVTIGLPPTRRPIRRRTYGRSERRTLLMRDERKKRERRRREINPSACGRFHATWRRDVRTYVRTRLPSRLDLQCNLRARADSSLFDRPAEMHDAGLSAGPCEQWSRPCSVRRSPDCILGASGTSRGRCDFATRFLSRGLFFDKKKKMKIPR